MAFMLKAMMTKRHGGHFAVVTERVNADGGYANWLVNNYYNLTSKSEKGIIAAPMSLDNYLADLKSGQSYCRPSYMLVAVFKTESLPAKFQVDTNQTYNHFYRNDFVYDHAIYASIR
jgi:predicted Abi (CAAX) family protease